MLGLTQQSLCRDSREGKGAPKSQAQRPRGDPAHEAGTHVSSPTSPCVLLSPSFSLSIGPRGPQDLRGYQLHGLFWGLSWRMRKMIDLLRSVGFADGSAFPT